MAPDKKKGAARDSGGGKGKDADKSKDDSSSKDKGKGGKDSKLKPATSVNVRHIPCEKFSKK
jgi:peptidyl-prolyl cis-trans isomerase NIMA-interacting 4